MLPDLLGAEGKGGFCLSWVGVYRADCRLIDFRVGGSRIAGPGSTRVDERIYSIKYLYSI